MRIKAVEPTRRLSLSAIWIAGLCALAVMVGACGSPPPLESSRSAGINATDMPSPLTSPGVVPSATPSLLASPTASPAPSAPADATLLCARPFEPCDLAPGTYHTQEFEVPFTFKIGKGWSNNRAEPTIGEVTLPGSGGIAWLTGVSEGRIGETLVSIGSTPTDFLAYLSDHPALRLDVPKVAKVGTASGQRVDVSVRRDAPEFLLLPDDAINLGKGHKLRFYLLEVEGATVVLILEALREEAFPAVRKLVQPILDSIRWRPDGA